MSEKNESFEPILTDSTCLLEFLSDHYEEMSPGQSGHTLGKVKKALDALGSGQAAYVSLGTDGIKLLPAPGGMVLIVRVQPKEVI